jgi:hypothetical protein
MTAEDRARAQKLEERIASLMERAMPKTPPAPPPPQLPAVSTQAAEAVHRQSGKRLLERHRQEAAQRALDFWMEEKLFAEEAEREFQRQLDPFNQGLYGAALFHRGRGER